VPLRLDGEVPRRPAGRGEQHAVGPEPLVLAEQLRKVDSMPSRQPNRTPSTRNVTGTEPGAYMYETLVFDNRRSS
jgi:hypothetical protein